MASVTNKDYNQIPVSDATFLVQEAVGEVQLPYGFENKDVNTGSVSNKKLGNSDLTWDEATFTWNEGSGTWENPYGIRNKGIEGA